ncbi:hypothetical protein CKO40_16200 [Halochromatium glycolicum]|uniref:Tetratricopeptide repeat protein n=2 Tax=Halochromatium glycolicum TaxID=85075 RepID=A0AAJ0XBE7_9GAMM|nr:hypothetical protein [Halochromatium glycolicum]
MDQGKVALARKAYLTALRLDPAFVPAHVNLADLYRALGSDTEAKERLRQGLAEALAAPSTNSAALAPRAARVSGFQPRRQVPAPAPQIAARGPLRQRGVATPPGQIAAGTQMRRPRRTAFGSQRPCRGVP